MLHTGIHHNFFLPYSSTVLKTQDYQNFPLLWIVACFKSAKATITVVHKETNHKYFSSLKKKILVHLSFDSWSIKPKLKLILAISI